MNLTSIRLCFVAAAFGAAPFVSGCSASSDSTSTASEDIYGYLDGTPDSWNMRVSQNIAYNQTLTGIHCTTASVRHPEAPQYQSNPTYCGVRLTANRLDRISAVVSNVDTWGTDQVEAYLLDASYRVIDQQKFEGNHDGWNTNKPITLNLSAGRQLQTGGTYYVAFIKYAIRDCGGICNAKYADDFSVQLTATKSADFPISLDHPPVRPGLYSTPKGDFMVDVVPPPAASVKDFSAWSAHVYPRGEGCTTPKSIADFSKIDCNDKACWFYETTKSFGGGASASGNWYLSQDRTTPTSVDFAFLGQAPVTMTWSRDTSSVERQGYEHPGACQITCPPTPPPPPHYENPCAGSGAPGWCFPGWQPPFGFESPLVLNMSAGTTIQFLGKGVPFDLDGAGSHPTDWVGPSYPLLALDLNGNGVIDDGRELFGTATIVKSTQKAAADGFTALAQYDDNGDRRIDHTDAIYRSLVLWFDRNGNGASDAGELTPLMWSGVDAINLAAQAQAKPANATGAFITYTSSFEEHVCSPSVSMFIADVWFPTATH